METHRYKYLSAATVLPLMALWITHTSEQQLLECTGIICPPLRNCIKAFHTPGYCCATCVLHGCLCPKTRRAFCEATGYPGKHVPGASLLHYAGEECSCPSGGGLLNCRPATNLSTTSTCPTIQPNCVRIERVRSSGCPVCLRRGCVYHGRSFPGGRAVRLPGCLLCRCPTNGGRLVCQTVSNCGNDTKIDLSTTPIISSQVTVTNAGGIEMKMRVLPRNVTSVSESSTESSASDVVPNTASSAFFTTSEVLGLVSTTFSTEDVTNTAVPTEVDSQTMVQLSSTFSTSFESSTQSAQASEVLMSTVMQCCGHGQRWARQQQRCADLLLISSTMEFCGMVGERCCLASLEEWTCQEGMATARQTHRCENRADMCAGNMHQACCNCCLLGLNLHNDSQPCAHLPGLGYLCSQVYHSCCLGNSTEPHADSTAEPNDEAGSEETRGNNIDTNVQRDHCQDNEICSQECVNTASGFLCSCHNGYRIKEDNVTCDDVNECLLEYHDCRMGQRCVNTAGSFRCQRELGCGTGYELMEDNVCQDINECEAKTHSCGSGFRCQNIPGSFRCRPKEQCADGFLQDAMGACIDINECLENDVCPEKYNCFNSPGSFSCKQQTLNCGRGYTNIPNGLHCVDVDECQTGVHRCGEGQTCINSPGSYSCNCRVGFYYNSIERTCVDIDECRQYPGQLCAQVCENTDGSYLCSCSPGFQLAPDRRNCNDVNECEESPCSHECVNIHGSFQCFCHRGYLKSDVNNTMCEDIDECALPGKLCSYRCINVQGSYECTCSHAGYTLTSDGRTCVDVDECQAGSINCSSGSSCFNIPGEYRCLSYPCPRNYRRSSPTRCERTSCSNVDECSNRPVRITYYQLSFPTSVPVPANIFRIGPSPAYAEDSILLSILDGDPQGYFSTQKLNGYRGIVYLKHVLDKPQDFLLNIEMKLFRKETITTFWARIYVFVTDATL
uniref:fibulin-1-like isoform X1 n=2 Tax=Myxine glutinosa TaxID=7769 RepID=UPI00358F448E